MIRSPELTQQLLSLVNFQSSSYRVEVDATGQLRWISPLDQVVHFSEPEASAMRVLGARLLGVGPASRLALARLASLLRMMARARRGLA